MPGVPPPPDLPSPSASVDPNALIPSIPDVTVDLQFSLSPPVIALCGFALPTFLFAFGVKLPKLPFPIPPKLPTFSLSLGIDCMMHNPVNISKGVKWGGGRKSTSEPDPDSAY